MWRACFLSKSTVLRNPSCFSVSSEAWPQQADPPLPKQASSTQDQQSCRVTGPSQRKMIPSQVQGRSLGSQHQVFWFNLLIRVQDITHVCFSGGKTEQKTHTWIAHTLVCLYCFIKTNLHRSLLRAFHSLWCWSRHRDLPTCCWAARRFRLAMVSLLELQS